MKFGAIPIAQAAGAVLAHSTQAGAQKFKKGRVLSAADSELLRQAGLTTVIGGQLEADDVGEDAAASAMAEALCGPGVTAAAAFTGRCNLFAAQPGVLIVDQDRLDQVNLVHADLTVATLPPFAVIDAKQMVATIKIIPFAVNKLQLERCLVLARAGAPILQVRAFTCAPVGLIQTALPGAKASVLDKAARVLQARVDALGGALVKELRCAHDETAVSEALRQLLADQIGLILIAGASAIVDRRDVIPAAIERVGGVVEHFGMPVDPGNLLLLGYHGAVPVVGLPGCARSPQYNGFDLVLVRLAAGLRVSQQDIMRMGAGGLLKETASRGAPRAANPPEQAPARAPRVAAVVLAAGQSRRMGRANKLLLPVDGKPMVAHAVAAVKAAQVETVIVVTGHESTRIMQALADSGVQFVHNPSYTEGISTSLRAGLAAVPADCDAVLVCLGDMPRVTAAQINRLIAAFDSVEGRAICVPTCEGKRGNPVLWAKRFGVEMLEISGDAGAKHLLGEHADLVCEVEMNDPAVLLDIDSPAELASLAAAEQ